MYEFTELEYRFIQFASRLAEHLHDAMEMIDSAHREEISFDECMGLIDEIEGTIDQYKNEYFPYAAEKDE